MTILQILMRIIKHFGLMETPDRQQLNIDVAGWEETATVDSDNKIKAMYGKVHQGVFVRVLLPFLFFIGVKELNKMLEVDIDKPDYLDED